jgi:hypothetical protein
VPHLLPMTNKQIVKDHVYEAKYWETNFEKAWQQGKPVTVKFAKNLSETINIRLDPKTLKTVRIEADKKGIGPSQLIRMWIKEKTLIT